MQESPEFDFPEDPKLPLKPFIPRWMAVFIVVGAVIILFLWSAGTPDGPLGKADAVAYAICHRIADRTFMIDPNTGTLMPLCARCTGIYLGVVVSMLFAVATRRTRVSRMPNWKISGILLIFVGIMGIDGLNSYIHLFNMEGIYEPHNWLRLVTGMYCGIAMFNFVFPAFNSIVWQKPDRSTRNIVNFRELIALCIMGAFMILLILSERPVFMWVLSFLSIVGVVMMLTMIGTVIFLSLAHLERKAVQWRQLAFPILAGATVAFIQIGGMDILRFALTHTWDGFKFS